MAAQSLPGWCGCLPSVAPFLASHASRSKLLACTAFGVSRAVVFLQQDNPASSTRALEQQLSALNERLVAMYMTGEDPQQLQRQVDAPPCATAAPQFVVLRMIFLLFGCFL